MQRITMTGQTIVISHPKLGEVCVIDIALYGGLEYEVKITDSFNEGELIYENTIPVNAEKHDPEFWPQHDSGLW